MGETEMSEPPKLLILATETCAYPGADYVGQTHAEYPASTYILRIPAPVLLPRDFYLRTFEKGIDGVIVMSCGHECPHEGAYDRLAVRISRTHADMKERGMDPKRLRLCAICTVCSRAFLKEVGQMHEYLAETRTAAATGKAHV
jgi:coenzyme F420-reducing hydrogenase delta subunit